MQAWKRHVTGKKMREEMGEMRQLRVISWITIQNVEDLRREEEDETERARGQGLKMWTTIVFSGAT